MDGIYHDFASEGITSVPGYSEPSYETDTVTVGDSIITVVTVTNTLKTSWLEIEKTFSGDDANVDFESVLFTLNGQTTGYSTQIKLSDFY